MDGDGGDSRLYAMCSGSSLRCLDVELACCASLGDCIGDNNNDTRWLLQMLWSIKDAHPVGISRLVRSPCGPALVTGDDERALQLWDTRMCGGVNDDNNSSQVN
jgi:hypothetical protein